MDAEPIHDVIVIVDDVDDGIRFARGLIIDGREVLIPGEATVSTEIGNTSPLTVTVTFFATDVRYLTERPA